MFEQHPVPQQISSYQFRLVGDMTLKQFFQLAAGAVVGLIIYSLPLPGFFKWPLIAIAVIGGAAFAFLPVQDRPLEQWLIAFFRSIYAPTIFVWRKPVEPISYFAPDTPATVAPPVEEPVTQNAPHNAAIHNMDTNEKDFLSKISSMFGSHTSPAPQTPSTLSVQTSPTMNQAMQPEPEPEPEKQELEIPIQKAVSVPRVEEKVEVKPPQVVPNEPANPTPVPQTLSGTINVAAQQAQFSPEAAPPLMPTSPNLVTGQVMDSAGKIVEGAILEISDKDGRPVRALKSNKAGHFLIVTPLPNGEYKIFIEKEPLKFEPVTFKAVGEIIAPIAIKAQNELPAPEPGRATWSI